MFRFLVVCGCLLAVAQAGVIGGGLLAATAPAAIAVHPASLPLSAAALAVPTLATSSSNIIRGPIAAPAFLAPGLTTIAAGPTITAGLAPLSLHGVALNGIRGLRIL